MANKIKIDGKNFGKSLDAIFLRDLLCYCNHGRTEAIRKSARQLYQDISKLLQYQDKFDNYWELRHD